MDYRISGERLKGFADQARRLGKVSGELTPGQIEEVLAGVTAGAALPSIHPLLIAVDATPTVLPKFAVNDLNIVVDASPDVLAKAEDTTPPPEPKYYYSGVLLPGIPADVLASYPYAWIRNNTRTGYYDLLLSQVKWYLKDEDTLAKSVEATKWYRIPIASADTSEAWTFNSDYDSLTWGNESDRRIMWSNHDIPNGSADATEIYFEGSEPVPAE